MELELKRIDFDADIYDVRKAIQEVLHGPEFYDPNDRENKGRKPNFQVIMGKSPAGRSHDGTAALRLPAKLGPQLLKWYRQSEKHRIVVNGRPLRLFRSDNHVRSDVKQVLEKALYVDPDQDKLRTQTEDCAHAVRLRIAIVQFGIWYKESYSPGTGRSFSVEYERNFLNHSAAYLFLEYEHKLLRIDIGQRETEETKYLILIKFSSIRKLGIGYDDSGQPFIIFDLHTPPTFEQESYNNRPSARESEGIERQKKLKKRDRISAIDEAHANIAPYAHHLRLILADQDDLLEFEKICKIVKCEPPPVRVPRVDAHAKQFFSPCNILHVKRWIMTMDWKNAFQIEGYLRCGLLNTHDLLVTLQKPIEDAIELYGDASSEFLRYFSEVLKARKADEDPRDCLKRTHSKWKPRSTPKPTLLTPLGPEDSLQDISCHHVIITPSRILLEGPYPTQSNRVIRRYQDHAPALAERFIRVEFRDEDHLSYRWDGDVDGTRFLQRRVGGILRRGFELGGREFEFLAYSSSALREHSVWFISPFRDPIEGYVTAEHIRSSLGDFSELLRMPSKYAARIAQAFTATDRSVKIRRDQWEEQPDLGPHTDGVGTISSQLADLIWGKWCEAGPNAREPVKPSAYQFRFLGYKGVVVVDYRLKGIKMRLRESQRKFPVNNVEEEYFEIAQSFHKPNKVYLNRPAVMALEDRGVDRHTFIELQEEAKSVIYSSLDSLDDFLKLLEAYCPGDKFGLASILEQLVNLELDFKDSSGKKAIKSVFFERILCYSMHHALRGIKFKARIRVPNSYQLVGVADEGRAYINEGVKEDDVFTLKPNEIYVCIQGPKDEKPTYLKGNCVISRSPVIHPGDVQPVFAVGEPPAREEKEFCFFRGLKNVVVLPAVGERSLASCLGGGDLDGDTYDIYYKNPGLLPPLGADPAAYPAGKPWELEEGREATVQDICDFIVEYIHSDVMGLLADRHIVIADQSKDGVFDQRCMKLAELCSQAVDYAKNGNPVNIDNLPKPLIRFKPDWHKAEVTGAHELDYYVSDRALGYLFRNVNLHDPKELVEDLSTGRSGETAPLEDAITCAVEPLIRPTLNAMHNNDKYPSDKAYEDDGYAEQLHAEYVREMRFICVTHTLVDAPDVRLTEEEVVLGTILANCTQSRWRSNRSYRMKQHTKDLVGSIRSQIIQCEGPPTEEQRRAALPRAWAVWCWAQHHRDREYIESFALLVLGTVFDSLRCHGILQETKSSRKKKVEG